MFNREMHVRLVKKNKDGQETTDPSNGNTEETVMAINEIFDNAIRKIGTLTIGYVLIDTGRKILVARASK